MKEDINSQRLLPYVCMTVFKSRNFNKHKNQQKMMHDKLASKFGGLIEQGRLLNAAAMLRGMYGLVIGTDDDGMVFLDEYYILEPKEVIELMSKCFNKLVEMYHPTDDDIIDSNSLLSLFVRNATSKSIEESAERKSLLCHNAFIAYFKSRIADNDIEKFYRTFYYDIYAEDHGAMPDEIKDNVRIKIGKSFGSEYTYREFMRECFNLTEEQRKMRNKYLEDYICPIC